MFHCVFQTFAIVFIESYSTLIITIELILELSTIHNLSGFFKIWCTLRILVYLFSVKMHDIEIYWARIMNSKCLTARHGLSLPKTRISGHQRWGVIIKPRDSFYLWFWPLSKNTLRPDKWLNLHSRLFFLKNSYKNTG